MWTWSQVVNRFQQCLTLQAIKLIPQAYPVLDPSCPNLSQMVSATCSLHLRPVFFLMPLGEGWVRLLFLIQRKKKQAGS